MKENQPKNYFSSKFPILTKIQVTKTYRRRFLKLEYLNSDRSKAHEFKNKFSTIFKLKKNTKKFMKKKILTHLLFIKSESTKNLSILESKDRIARL